MAKDYFNLSCLFPSFFFNIIVHILLGNNRSAYKWKWIISDITINIYWIQRRGLNAKYKNICGFSS